jgi:hypothetical protein
MNAMSVDQLQRCAGTLPDTTPTPKKFGDTPRKG